MLPPQQPCNAHMLQLCFQAVEASPCGIDAMATCRFSAFHTLLMAHCVLQVLTVPWAMKQMLPPQHPAKAHMLQLCFQAVEAPSAVVVCKASSTS